MSPQDFTFSANAAGFCDPVATPSIMAVWQLSPDELVASASSGLEALSPSIVRDLTWKSQALLEFQDLQPIHVPREGGPFIKVHFPFYEGLAAFRSSVLAALNHNVRASLPVLRTALELCLFHQWWQARAQDRRYHAKFYSWLNAKNGAPSMSQIRRDLFSSTSFPQAAVSENSVCSLYGRLCVHAHKAQFRDSLPVLSGSNIGGPSAPKLNYWAKLFIRTLETVLDVLVAYSPQCLFPVDLQRKFGFSPPVGMYFDQSNFIALREALGAERIAAYQQHFADVSPELLSFATSRTDLSNDEILASWTGEEPNDDHLDAQSRVFQRATRLKAQMRALLIGMTYSDRDVSV